MKGISILVSILILTGCATSYQSGAFSYTGGYYEVPVNEKLTKVVFSGNGFLENETASQYTLFRCAELANKQNKPYFYIYENLFQASLEHPSKTVSNGSVGGKPITYTYVRFLDREADGAISTKEILAQLEASKKKSHTQKNESAKKKGDSK